MTVFDVFQETPYDFLQIERGTVQGDEIIAERSLMGVFKYREGEEQVGTNMELPISSATLHAHPDDDFGVTDLVGHGVRVNGLTYGITNVTGGMNFDNGQMEHLTLTLQRADFIDGIADHDS